MHHKILDGCAPCFNTPVTLSPKYPINVSPTYLELSPNAMMKHNYEKETKVPLTSSFKSIGFPTTTNCDCQNIAIKLIQNCINELTLLKLNKIESQVCEHCKHLIYFKCNRCEYISNQRSCNTFDQVQIRLAKVKRILEAIFKSDTSCLTCDKINLELSNLLKELKFSLVSLKLSFSTYLSNVVVDEIVGVLDSILISYKKAQTSVLDTESFEQRHDLSKLITYDPTEVHMRVPLSTLNDENSIETKDINDNVPKKTNNNRGQIDERNKQSKMMNKDIKQKSKHMEKENSIKTASNGQKSDTIKSKNKSKKGSPSEELMRKMLSDLKKEKARNRIKGIFPNEKDIRKISVTIDSLPELKMELIEKSDSEESGVVECYHKERDPPKIIFGTKLVYKNLWESSSKHVTAGSVTKESVTSGSILMGSDTTGSINKDDRIPDESLKFPTPVVSTPVVNKTKKKEIIKENLNPDLKFQLSDLEYIKRGWTQLPSAKIMEVCYVFQGSPAVNTKNDWFEIHKTTANYFYDDGNILAKVEPPFGRWYYRSGKIALEHFKSDDGATSSQRCVVYSSHYMKRNKGDQINILALFDYMGNGIIYDQNGNERLKYNQNGGVIIDNKIGPAVGWKWHNTDTANELKTVYCEKILKNTDEKIKNNVKDDGFSFVSNENADKSILEIELQAETKKLAKLNVKNKAAAFKQKIVKINDYFSLHMKDQQNITLRFNTHPSLMKLNLGIQLDKSKIASKIVREKSMNAITPYDRFVPFAESLNEIENKLGKLRNN